jgi:hypothetical protein
MACDGLWSSIEQVGEILRIFSQIASLTYTGDCVLTLPKLVDGIHSP